MILGIGTDILALQRLREMPSARLQALAKRVLTPAELARWQALAEAQQAPVLGKRFAAKEAIAKAYGTGIGAQLSFQDITLAHDGLGKPYFELAEAAARELCQLHGVARLVCHLSVSDEADYAQAYALIEGHVDAAVSPLMPSSER